MTLKELKRRLQAGERPEIEIHSVDPMIYLLFERLGERLAPVDDGRGTSLKYKSRFAAKRALASTGLKRAAFVHRSAYGEMIGMEGMSEQSELREEVDLSAFEPER